MDSSNQVAEWEVRASLGGRLMVSRSASRHRGGSVPEPLTDIFEAPGDKKICALGLLQLLALPAEAMPLDLQAGMSQVLMGATTLLADMKVAEDEAANEEGLAGDDDDDEEEEDDDLEADEGEDDDEDEGDEQSNADRMAQRVSSIR
eukprot:805622-Prorocentrum_minimum.AAC.2